MPYFEPFNISHRAVLALMAASAAGVYLLAPRIRRLRDDRLLRVALCVLLGATALAGWIRILYFHGWYVPFQLCDFALISTIWCLVRKNRILGELAFFWGVAGSTQAVLTPDLVRDYPSYEWISFFITHCGVVLGALYLAARGRLELSAASAWRVWGWLQLYAAGAGILNFLLGANFGYLAAKPARPSLLDYLGPWPYYILSLQVLALALFFLTFALGRALERRAQGTRP